MSSECGGPRWTWDVAVKSDVGRARADNQDTALVADAAGARLLAVFDGMGGHAGGAVASARAAAAVAEALAVARAADSPALARALDGALVYANAAVQEAARDPRLYGMGTTATVAGIVGAELVLAQVGDSRAYLFRAGRLYQLTRDQTLVQVMIENGQLRPCDARSCELGNVILQAIGTSRHLDVDLRAVQLRRGDVLLVCSDGLHGVVDESQIASLLAGASSAAEAVERLVEAALAEGGPDNVTCVVARLGDAPLPERAPADDAVDEPARKVIFPRDR